MTAALIGLIGVIAGALLGGLVNAWVERRRQRTAAWVAARLIAAELDVVERRVSSAIQNKNWWPGELPTNAWKAQLANLASGPASLTKLVAAYEKIELLERRPQDAERVRRVGRRSC